MVRKLCLVMVLIMTLTTPASAWTYPVATNQANPQVQPPADEPPPVDPEAARDEQAVQPTQPVLAGAPPAPHTIHLKSREFLPSAPDIQALGRLSCPEGGRVHLLVQLDFIPRQAAKAALEAGGLKLQAYVPDYTWIASFPAFDVTALLKLPGVTWAGELTIDDKLDPVIRDNQWAPYNLMPDGTAAVYVALYGDEDLEAGRALVERYGGKITGQVLGINVLVAEIPRDNIRSLAAEEAVQWIEAAQPALGEANDGIRQQIGVDTLQAAPYNLDGTGVDVLVYDGGQVGAHVDFGVRVTHGDGVAVTEHATHVAGTLGGTGANSASQGGTALQWRGMATNVDIISYAYEWSYVGYLFYNNPGDIEADWAAAQNTYGADIGTASLGANIYANYYPAGCAIMGKYGMSSVLLDQMIRGGNSLVGIGDKYIATWAVGNERGWGTSCTPNYSLVAPPADAKNPIQVGGSNTNDNTQYAHTSWGPTQDGRIKPIVTAGACQTTGDLGVTSTDNNPVNAYTVKCGTSMATPAVAGSIALMLQQYRAVYNTSGNFWPSTAKAILIQTADDLGNPGPDYQWGYGQVNVPAAVDLITRKAFRQESLVQGDVDSYYFIVPDSTNPARVTLAWDDFEATFNANPTLINNLDLELVSPSGTVWRPWILDPSNPANNATRGVDNRNNQEMVEVPAPEVGTWIVRVHGLTVPQGPQDYSLVCEGCKPLDAGVCQASVGSMMQGMSAIQDASLPELLGPAQSPESDPSSGGVLPSREAPTTGELWQRALEAEGAAQSGGVEADTMAGLAALEAARRVGPQAVVGLLGTLTGRARDLAMDEIVEAQGRLAAAAPPAPETPQVSEAEEQAVNQAQEAAAAANRAQAFKDFNDPLEGAGVGGSSVPPQYSGPAADRTVGTPPCTYATISAAITAANPGDRLLIEGNVTFVENLTINKDLILQGGYNGCGSASSNRTTINGNASGSVVVISPGLNVTLVILNITNGYYSGEGGGIRLAIGTGSGTLTLNNVYIYANTALWGGGLWIGQNAEVVGTSVNIYSNVATAYGGGVRLFGGHATFTSSNIYNNVAPLGGGVYATREGSYTPELNLPSSADVYGNQSTTGSGLGGGVYMKQGSLSLTDCSDIYSNSAINGGGAYLITSTLTINGSCSEIDSNAASGSGGGVYAQGSTIYLQDSVELLYNTGASGYGGGAYLDNSSLYSGKSAIYYNTAGYYGGGIYAINGSSVVMNLGSYTCLGTRCSVLSNNTTTVYYGGGVFANGSSVYLYNTFIESNSASYGGGVYVYSGSLYVNNNLFARNHATGNIGDGIRLNSASMSGTGNTLAFNDSGGASTGRAIDLSSSSLTLGCSVVWGHASSINVAGQSITYSDVQGGYAGAGNLNVNPLFVASGSQDYHLQSSSSLIDRCVTGVSPDFENEARPIVRLNAASPYDMGADEVTGAVRVGVNGACAYATIQSAVNAASDGDTIQVAAGVFFENVDNNGKSLTIEGGYDNTCTVPNTGTTRIEGSLTPGSTFDLLGGTVVLRNLGIVWGSGTGAGIDVDGGAQVMLDNTDVFNNHGDFGGGIWLNTGVTVTATNGSTVHDNTAMSAGGGVRVWGRYNDNDTGPDTAFNCAPDGGGFSVPGGTLHLTSSDVMGNLAAGATGKGGGAFVEAGGVITLTNDVYFGDISQYGNQAYDGGAIYADSSSVHMEGASATLSNNTAVHFGGGVYLANQSTLYVTGGRIGSNYTSETGNDAVLGAGVYAIDSTVDFAGRFYNNIASDSGGALYATNSTLNLSNATLGGTDTNRPNKIGVSGFGGAGLYLTTNTKAALSNTVIDSNILQNSVVGYGGGAYVSAGSVMTMTNSTIERHTAPSVGDGRGAGIYINGSMVTLDNSRVISNTAGTLGGGVRLFSTGTLNALNGSTISNNQSLNGTGGGISSSGAVDINITNTALQHNTARTDGGAIYQDAGTLDLTGWWDLRYNHADGNGGGVAVVASADVDFVVNGGASLLAVNSAGGNGGGLYITNNDYVTLYATNGYQLNLNTNSAGGNGGAIYANGGAFLDIYGKVQATSNSASGNGGVFYLAGGSQAWFDDYFNDSPQIWVNQAGGNGGAIYAAGSPQVWCDGAEFGGGTNGNTADTGNGGAVYLSGSTFSAYNCTFRNNQAALDGGAVAAYASTVTISASYPAGVTHGAAPDRLNPDAPQATACDPLSRQCSSFSNNLADRDSNNSGNGGAIYVNGSTLTVDDTTMHRNQAMRGGAIYQGGGSAVATVQNTLIYSNTSTATFGAGIRVEAGDFTVRHVTLANNINGAGYSHSGAQSHIYNSIAWGNTNGGFWMEPFADAVCNIDQSGYAGSNVDPRFVAPGGGEDYHLQGDSPAINACASGLPRDLDNVIRPLGSGYDMGPYEYISYAVTFIPDYTTSEAPLGKTYIYTHTLTNSGNITDTYTLAFTSSAGWGSLLDPGPYSLAPGASATVRVHVTVPPGSYGTTDTTVVTATSQSKGTVQAHVTDTTVATSIRKIYLPILVKVY